MAFKYEQATGYLLGDSGEQITRGYSGYMRGKNNPSMEAVHDVGPIPKGVWSIGPMLEDGGHMGPHVIPLHPVPSTDTFGRDGFFIHGDSILNPGFASRGCIVLNLHARFLISASGQKTLVVI